MTAKSKFLHSRVARRIFALFVLCALLPMAVLTSLSFVQVSSQLRTQARRQLQQNAKSLGLALYERLMMLESEMQLSSLHARNNDPLPSLAEGSRFQKMTVWTGSYAVAAALSAITNTERAHLLTGKSLIRTAPCSTNNTAKCVVLIKMIEPKAPYRGLMVGEVNASYLWSADRLPADVDLTVVGPSGLLYSSSPEKTPASALLARRDATGILEWKSQGKVYEAAYRDLFLRPEFFTDTWTVVVSQSQKEAVATLQQFRNTLLLVTLLAMWIVILLSLIQIRQTTGPLEKLSEGTKRIAEQDFDTRVEITSGDEFEDLAASFNSMSSRLGRQFHVLHAINEIDQAILSSLNRDAVVRTALSRMNKLLPGDCFAMAVFQTDSSGAASTQVTVSEPQPDGSEVQRIFTTEIASLRELQELRQQRVVHAQLGLVNTPEYLKPLKEMGTASACVFPIMLDQTPFAALICGNKQNTHVTDDDLHHGEQIADQLAVAFSNVCLVEAMEQLHWGTLTALARAIDAKSTWTAGHSERVTQTAMRIGRAMGLSPRDLQVIHRGGLLHDVGKIGISREVLDKPGMLEPHEMQFMRDHVRIGVRILEPIAAFTEALPIVAQHHEWFNGKGYPAGLAGEEISLHARILAVADCYDALASDRPYRQGLPKQRVLEMLREKSGTQFDPKVIEVFVRLADDEAADSVANDDLRLTEQAT